MIDTLAPGPVTLTATVKDIQIKTTANDKSLGIYLLSDDKTTIKCLVFEEQLDMMKIVKIDGKYEFRNIKCVPNRNNASELELKMHESTLIHVVEEPTPMTLAKIATLPEESVISNVFGVVTSVDDDFSRTANDKPKHRFTISDPTYENFDVVRFGAATEFEIKKYDIVMITRAKISRNASIFVFEVFQVNPPNVHAELMDFKASLESNKKTICNVEDLVRMSAKSKVIFECIAVEQTSGVTRTANGQNKRTLKVMGLDKKTISVTLFNHACDTDINAGQTLLLNASTSDYDQHSLCVWNSTDVTLKSPNHEQALMDLYASMDGSQLTSVSVAPPPEILLSDIANYENQRVTVNGTCVVMNSIVYLKNGDASVVVEGNCAQFEDFKKMNISNALVTNSKLIIDGNTMWKLI